MKGLLLAGGYGTRLRPLTFTGNKHMLPIANKPMLSYGLNHLILAGIKEIGIILGPMKEGIREAYGDGEKLGVELTYIEQPEPKGLAHAIMISEDFLGESPFVMYLGDNLLKDGLGELIEVFNKQRCDFVGAVTRVSNPESYGVVVFDENGRVKQLIEKPKQFVSEHALVGVYLFSRKVFDAVKKIRPSWRGEYEITDTIQTMLDDGARIEVRQLQGWWKDTGKPEDLLTANQLILSDQRREILGVIEEGATVENSVRIGEQTVIHPYTTIRGPVIIGTECEIGPEVYIGPYTSIGNNCVLKNTELENSIVMDNVKIDSGNRITDSIIGRGVEIKQSKQNVPRSHQMILGDMSKLTL